LKPGSVVAAPHLLKKVGQRCAPPVPESRLWAMGAYAWLLQTENDEIVARPDKALLVLFVSVRRPRL
jgi:hypothetical protein